MMRLDCLDVRQLLNKCFRKRNSFSRSKDEPLSSSRNRVKGSNISSTFLVKRGIETLNNNGGKIPGISLI